MITTVAVKSGPNAGFYAKWGTHYVYEDCVVYDL